MAWVSTDYTYRSVTTNHFAVTAHCFYRSTNFHKLLQDASDHELDRQGLVCGGLLSLKLSHIAVTLSALALEP